MINKNNTILALMFFAITGIFCKPLLSSCGKGAATGGIGLNTQLQILNLSPDVHPVNLYINFIKQNTGTYTYPYNSGYFYLPSLDTPFQIRSTLTSTANANLLTVNYLFKSNHKYSLFITGISAKDSLVGLVTADDTASIPAVGFGKIRFINASVLSPKLDVLANGIPAFTGIAYKNISKYVQLPAGNYNFKLSPTGSAGTIISTNLQYTTIQDGRLYTLYTYGEIGHTDSAAFGAGVLTNR